MFLVGIVVLGLAAVLVGLGCYFLVLSRQGSSR